MRTRAIAVLLCLAGTATATDHPEEAAKLLLKDVDGRRALAWSAKMPPPALPATSPVTVGATLVVRTAAGETASFDLPASGWTVNRSGTTFKYKNALAPAGPSGVKRATVKDLRVVKVAGKDIGITLDEAAQGTVSIALTIGDDVYCSSCTTARRDEPGRFAAARCPAPPDCAVPSTTTSTTLPSCGNGVIDSGEDCDGTALGICGLFGEEAMISCKPPPAPDACTCCHPTDCAFVFMEGLPSIHCCGDTACQDTRGFGMVQPGVCIPPSCTNDADCNGYRCVGGTCCGNAGQFCGVVDCCADSNATCTTATWSAFISGCCRQAAAACTDSRECCSGSCVSGQCQ